MHKPLAVLAGAACDPTRTQYKVCCAMSVPCREPITGAGHHHLVGSDHSGADVWALSCQEPR